MNRPFIIPKTEDFDYHKTGFYALKNSDELNFRIQESTLELDGIIRLNKNASNGENIFEGFNGTKWVQFNAEKGDTGEKGDDFNNQFKFINCSTDDTISTENNGGLIFKNSEKVDETTTKIHLRTLKSDKLDYNNGQMNINTISILTKENDILFKSLPQPYNWDISKLSLKEMKSQKTNEIFKCYGQIITVKISRKKQ